jgi:hypothetical protein
MGPAHEQCSLNTFLSPVQKPTEAHPSETQDRGNRRVPWCRRTDKPPVPCRRRVGPRSPPLSLLHAIKAFGGRSFPLFAAFSATSFLRRCQLAAVLAPPFGSSSHVTNPHGFTVVLP